MARAAKRRYGWLWAAGLFFSAGYLITALGIPPMPRATSTTASASRPAPPATLPAPMAPARYEPLESPLYAMVAMVALMIPFAARTVGLLRGALRGLGLGAAGGAGIAFALNKVAGRVSPEDLRVASALAILTSTICCAATGAIFAFLAERRRRRFSAQ